jgi:hypothetical protein
MEKSLEDWEKEFVKPDDIQEEDLKKLLEKASQFCEIQSDGYVRIKKVGKGGLSDKAQIHLILVARYLAHELQTRLGRENPISATVRVSELEQMLRTSSKTITSRISDLRKEHAIEDGTRGEYMIKLPAIDDFLEDLVSTYGGSD